MVPTDLDPDLINFEDCMQYCHLPVRCNENLRMLTAGQVYSLFRTVLKQCPGQRWVSVFQTAQSHCDVNFHFLLFIKNYACMRAWKSLLPETNILLFSPPPPTERIFHWAPAAPYTKVTLGYFSVLCTLAYSVGQVPRHSLQISHCLFSRV